MELAKHFLYLKDTIGIQEQGLNLGTHRRPSVYSLYVYFVSKRTVGNTSLEKKDEKTTKFRRYENTNNKQPDQHKTYNEGPKQNPKLFIIDGLKQKFQNVEPTTKEIKRCKPENNIDSIRLLHKGGVLVFVKDNKSFNMALKDWPANAFEGQKKTYI